MKGAVLSLERLQNEILDTFLPVNWTMKNEQKILIRRKGHKNISGIASVGYEKIHCNVIINQLFERAYMDSKMEMAKKTVWNQFVWSSKCL